MTDEFTRFATKQKYGIPIRTGCYVVFRQIYKKARYIRVVRGKVIDEYYDANGHHIFVISDDGERSVTVNGAVIYNNLLHHVRGEASKIEERRSRKRSKKKKKRMERSNKRSHRKRIRQRAFSPKYSKN